MKQLAPNPDTLARRDEIVAGLRALVPGEGVIADTLRLKPYETDGLAIYRQPPMAVGAAGGHRTGGGGAAVLPEDGRAGDTARGRHPRSPAGRCRWPIAWWWA